MGSCEFVWFPTFVRGDIPPPPPAAPDEVATDVVTDVDAGACTANVVASAPTPLCVFAGAAVDTTLFFPSNARSSVVKSPWWCGSEKSVGSRSSECD